MKSKERSSPELSYTNADGQCHLTKWIRWWPLLLVQIFRMLRQIFNIANRVIKDHLRKDWNRFWRHPTPRTHTHTPRRQWAVASCPSPLRHRSMVHFIRNKEEVSFCYILIELAFSLKKSIKFSPTNPLISISSVYTKCIYARATLSLQK